MKATFRCYAIFFCICCAFVEFFLVVHFHRHPFYVLILLPAIQSEIWYEKAYVLRIFGYKQNMLNKMFLYIQFVQSPRALTFCISIFECFLWKSKLEIARTEGECLLNFVQFIHFIHTFFVLCLI